jgi:hypothetical protein
MFWALAFSPKPKAIIRAIIRAILGMILKHKIQSVVRMICTLEV